MRLAISERLLQVALHVAGSKIHFDRFVADTVNAHLGLLEASEDLESVLSLLERSNNQGAQKRLEKVKTKLDSALEVLRTLDALYATGKLSFGDRAPQVKSKMYKRKVRDLESSQEKPAPDRPTRKN